MTVVVPSNYVGVATRRLLASGSLGPVCGRGSGLAGVTFATVYRLAELHGSARLAGSGRRPVSTPVIAAALRTALVQEPGIFAPVARHAATETALVSAYRELRDLSDEALDALATTSGRAHDVVRLHLAARTSLEQVFYDEEDLLAAAAESIATDGGIAERLGPVIVYLPERLSRHAGRLLGTIVDGGELTVLAGTTGDARADAEVERSIRRIEPTAVGAPFENDELLGVVDPQRTRIVTASDGDEEVRAAVRSIVDAARSGTPLDRMAILHASPQPYAAAGPRAADGRRPRAEWCVRDATHRPHRRAHPAGVPQPARRWVSAGGCLRLARGFARSARRKVGLGGGVGTLVARRRSRRGPHRLGSPLGHLGGETGE